MKNTNTFSKFVLASTMITSIILPSFTFAATKEPKDATNFCAELATKKTEVLTKISEHATKQGTKHSDREFKIENKFSVRDANKITKQESKDSNFTAKISELKTKYPEAEKQTAIANFENTVNQARDLKQNKLETVVTSFRTQLEALITSKTGNSETVVNDFKTKATAAFDHAQTSCDNGLDANTIKSTFKSEMDLAKTGLKDSKDGLNSIKFQVEQSANDKKTAATTIQQEFKASVESASQILKEALK